MKNTKWFIFSGGKLLLKKGQREDDYEVPAGDMPPVSPAEGIHVHSFEMENCSAKSFVMAEEVSLLEDMEFVPLRRSFFLLPQEIYRMAGKMEELIYWDKETQYCGRCGGKQEYSSPISKNARVAVIRFGRGFRLQSSCL